MSLLPYVDLLKYAKEHKITLPAMNIFNMESSQAVVRAADMKDCPIIVQVVHRDIVLAGICYAAAIVGIAAEEAKVKVALGLDHGSSYEEVKMCVDCGFTGVMIDLSCQDYDTNVRETRKVVGYAHERGVSVEAELGTIQNGMASLEEIEAGYTDPKTARAFVKDTGIDCLAVSIGTAHGMYKHKPRINFDLLKELLETIPCAIVIHGGSGTPDEDVEKMVKMGVSKLNIGTDLFNAYREAIINILREEVNPPPSKMMDAARANMIKVALHKIDILTRFRV